MPGAINNRMTSC